MKLLDPHFYYQAANVIAALIVFLSALKKVVTHLKPLAKTFYKINWPNVWVATQSIRRRLAEELTLPQEHPFLNKASTLAFAVVFYFLTINCLVLLALDVCLAFFTRDMAAWRRIIGVGVACIIFFLARWCLVQGEKSRLDFMGR